VLHRLLHDLGLLVDHLHVVHQVLNRTRTRLSLLQQPDTLEVSHLVDEGLTRRLGVHHQLGLVRLLVDRVLVGEREDCRLVELSLEGDVEVDWFVLEDVRQRLRVGDYAFHQFLVVAELHAADEGGEGVGEQLNDLFGGVFVVGDEDVVALSLFGAAEDQVF
jgi:hypothetical protein